METVDFVLLKNFKLLNQNKVKNNCEFFKVSNFCYERPLWLFAQGPKKLVKPLQCTEGGGI